MATKKGLSSINDKQQSFLTSHTDNSDNKYSNINLNQNYKCSTFSFAQFKSKSKSNNKKFASSENFKGRESPKSWRKLSDQNLTTFIPLKAHDEAEENVKNQWKKDPLNPTKSTLSLHIAAYENSNDDNVRSIDENEGLKINLGEFDLAKKWKTVKQLFTGVLPAVQISFEIPRQQKEEQSNDPEVMQFKASQKLLNPNQSPSSSTNMRANQRQTHNTEMKDKPLMEGVIILQVWRRGAITILADTCGQIISHSSSYKFDMEDDDDVVALVEKVAEIHNKHENQDFKGILVQLFLDEKDAQFDITYKFCNFCKECFGENKIPFHITTLPTFSAYTALLNSHTNISNDEKVMIVHTGEIYHSGEMKNYCLQILIKRDSNNYQFVYSTIILDEKALAAAKEMIKEKYNPKKVILIQLFPKSAALHREKLTSETNPFLAAKKVLKSFHPICIPQSFATLSMEAGAKMIMNLVNGYEDQVNIFPHCRDRYAIVSSMKKKYLIKIELNEYLPLEVSVIFDLKDENDESLKLVALDQLTEKSYILAKINPADFQCKRVKAVLKLDINSLFDFYVEPAGDDDELTAYLEEEYSMEEIDLVEEPEEEGESEEESVSTCTEPTTEEEEKNNAEKEKAEENRKLIPEEDSCGESSENYDSDDIENGFDNSTIGWDDTDEIDFDVGSVTSIESFMQNDPGYKTRVIFDKQYFWILSDGNEEYEKVPIYIAFNEEKPIVGEAAKVLFETQPSFVVYDLIEICSSMNEKTSNSNWSFSLKNDSDGILSFFFESINGSTKSTPDFLVAIVLKHCLRLVKQKTGEKVNELFIAFNFPNPSDELKNVFQDAAKLLPLKPKIVFC